MCRQRKGAVMNATSLVLLAVFGARPVACQAVDVAAAMDFEVAGAWMTAPELTDEFPEEDLWSTRTLPFAELAGGVKLSDEHVKSGSTSAKWADHPRYPTVHTRHVPRDWSKCRALALWVYSEEETGERITLAVESDS